MEKIFLAFFLFAVLGCAGNRAESSPSGDSGCDDCGEQGELELEIHDEKGYVEINPDAMKMWNASAVLGSFPSQKIVAECPEENKICHSFSEDAVDFDLAHFEDSLIETRFSKMQHEEMLEGLRIPDADSLEMRKRMAAILDAHFADGKSLKDLSPWEERADFPIVYSAFNREVSPQLKKKLQEIFKKYRVRYVSIPVYVQVSIRPKLGKKGGFVWKSLWTLWDVRLGELVFLNYQEFIAETTSRIPPERGWAKPFAERLGKALSRDPKTIENH